MDLVFGVLVSISRRDLVVMVDHAYPFCTMYCNVLLLLLLLGLVACFGSKCVKMNSFSYLISCSTDLGTESLSR